MGNYNGLNGFILVATRLNALVKLRIKRCL